LRDIRKADLSADHGEGSHRWTRITQIRAGGKESTETRRIYPQIRPRNADGMEIQEGYGREEPRMDAKEREN
jgi:hypothetical protein